MKAFISFTPELVVHCVETLWVTLLFHVTGTKVLFSPVASDDKGRIPAVISGSFGIQSFWSSGLFEHCARHLMTLQTGQYSPAKILRYEHLALEKKVEGMLPNAARS